VTAEGVGTSFPTEPFFRHLIVGGLYRYVRNPTHLAFVAAIIGQALLLSRPVLLIDPAALLAARVPFVHWLGGRPARRFGEQYEAYCRQVPGRWPRLPGRTPGRRAEPGNEEHQPMETSRRVKDHLSPVKDQAKPAKGPKGPVARLVHEKAAELPHPDQARHNAARRSGRLSGMI
jgi:hypothetical protein